MNALALQIAGILAILAGLGHGFLGDKTLRATAIEPAHLKNFIRACYQFGSLGWIAGGILFLAAPSYMTAPAQTWLVLAFAPVYGFGAAVNAWGMQRLHPGSIMLLAVVVLSIIGVKL